MDPIKRVEIRLHVDEDTSTQLVAAWLITLSLITAPLGIIVATCLQTKTTTDLALIPLCIASVIEGTANMFLAALFHSSWTDLARDMDQSLSVICSANAAFNVLTSVLQSYGLAMLAWTRKNVFKVPDKNIYSKRLTQTSRVFMLSLNAGAVIILVPVFFKVVDCRYFQQRYFCSYIRVINNEGSMATAIGIMSLGYILPWLAITVSWITILRNFFKIRQRMEHMQLVALHRAANNSSPVQGIHSNVTIADSFSYANIDTNVFLLVIYLTFFHILLVLPDIIIFLISPFSLNWNLTHIHHLFLNETKSVPDNLRAIITPSYESIFTWTRYLYSILAPILICIFHKDVQSSFKFFFCCGKKSLIIRKPVKDLVLRGRQKRSKIQHRATKNTSVLFATSNGLYLRSTDTAPCKFADVTSNEISLKKMKPRRRPLPTLSNSPPKGIRHNVNDLEVRKGGKSVRFSQRVNEIPFEVTVYGISATRTSVDVLPTPMATVHQQLSAEPKYQVPPRTGEPFLRKKVFKSDSTSERISMKKGNKNDFTEIDYKSSNALNSSSSSLLSFEQRLRYRD